MRSEVVAEVTKLRAQELEQAQRELQQQLQQQVLHHKASHCSKLLSGCIVESCGPAMPAVHMPPMYHCWCHTCGLTSLSVAGTVTVYSTPQDKADFKTSISVA